MTVPVARNNNSFEVCSIHSSVVNEKIEKQIAVSPELIPSEVSPTFSWKDRLMTELAHIKKDAAFGYQNGASQSAIDQTILGLTCVAIGVKCLLGASAPHKPFSSHEMKPYIWVGTAIAGIGAATIIKTNSISNILKIGACLAVAPALIGSVLVARGVIDGKITTLLGAAAAQTGAVIAGVTVELFFMSFPLVVPVTVLGAVRGTQKAMQIWPLSIAREPLNTGFGVISNITHGIFQRSGIIV
ncbi:MAG TPA: hypothetical protein VGP47_06185 [Parachlamydiaceae bacterium]|nr:hypothetical protein [Parachlamydiaceae bacterium]